MSAPYSDNLYSTNEDEDEAVLSPTDGYFHASSSSDVASASHHNTAATTTTTSSSRLHVPVVPNVMVEDPTVREEQEAMADKVREAEQERRINTTGSYYETRGGGAAAATSENSSRTAANDNRQSVEDEEQSTTTYSTQTRHQHQHSSSVTTHHGLEAPPAYSPSSPTQQQPTTSTRSTRTGYHTFGPAGLPLPNAMGSGGSGGVAAEQQGLLSRGPQSMGDGAPHRHGENLWERARDAWQFGNLRKWTTRILGILVIVAIPLAILGAFEGGRSYHWNKRPGNGIKDPVKVPSSPGGDDMDPSFPTQCFNRPYRFAKIGSEIEFNPERTLTIIQKPDEEEREYPPFRPHVHVTGEVIVRPVKSSSVGKIEFEVIANSKDLNVRIDFDEALQKAVIISPRRAEWGDVSEMVPCIQIRVTVWVPQGASLKGLDFSLVHLDVELFQGLSLAAGGQGSRISTVVGDVVAPTLQDDDVSSIAVDLRPYRLDSRNIYLKTISGDIKGWYPLYDTLKVSTGAGEIDIVAGPQPVDKDNPKPASLEVESISGTVKVREPVDAALVVSEEKNNPAGFPPRDFSVTVETVSSDITAVLAFTSLGEFKSLSGDLDLRLWPILDLDKTYTINRRRTASGPQLTTDSKSGDTKVDLREPRYIVTDASSSFSSIQQQQYQFASSSSSSSSSSVSAHPLTLFSKHSSTSGDIHLSYPSAWEGKLHAQTLSGSQHFAGKGLDITRKGGSFRSVLDGKKGQNGKSYLSVESISGNEEFLVGEE